MADPTQPLRDKISSALRSAIPESSPLAQSLEAEKKQDEVDRINTEMKQAQPVQAVSNHPQVAFVPQVAPVATPVSNQVSGGPAQSLDFNADLPRELRGGLNEQRQAYQQEAQAYQQAGQEIAQIESQMGAEAQAEIDARQQAEDTEKELSKEIEERSRMRLEPKNFFSGKNTWQKIMSGLGLYLSSFSKEGAARFAEAVDRDIELDLKAQESAINAKDKSIADKQTLVKQYFDKYKDLRAARLMARADAFAMVKARAEFAANKAKSQAAAGAATQAIGLAEAEMVKARQAAVAQLLSKQADFQTKNAGRMVEALGFQGFAPTEAEAKEFRGQAADAKQAIDQIKILKGLAAKGSKVNQQDRAQAETVARLLGASLRTTVVGQGAVSDTERAILEKIAANPLDIFSLSAAQLARLGTLESQIRANLRSKAGIFGLQEIGVNAKGPM